MLRPAGKEVAKKGVKGFIASKKLPNRVVKGFIGEGLQEDAQTLWQNAVAKYGYDETQELAEGLVESFIGGGGMGSIMGGAMKPRATTTERYDKAVDKIRTLGKDAGFTDEEIDADIDTLGRSMVDDIERKADKMISDEERDFIEQFAADKAKEAEVNPEKDKILGTAEIDAEAKTADLDPEFKALGKKALEVDQKIEDAKKAKVLKEAEDLEIKTRQEKVEATIADIVDSETETTLNGAIEDTEFSSDEETKVRESVATTFAKQAEQKADEDAKAAEEEAAKAEEVAAKEAAEPTEFNLEGILPQVEKGATVTTKVTERDDDGNESVKDVEVDAKTELEDQNRRYEIYNKILNCMAG
jgi:hypothetical protein